MLLAHGFFKAPLFLVDRHRRPRDRHPGRAQALGAVDVAARQRDHRRRGGGLDGRAAAAARLRRQGGRRSRRSSPRTTCAAGSSPLALVAGSVFTVAYSARFLWGAFARKPGVADTPVHRPGPLLTVAGRALRGSAGSCSASRTPWSTPTRRATPPPTRPPPRGGRATTSRCGTASGCRCWRPPSRSCSATRCTAAWSRSDGSPASCRARCRRSAPTSSPSAAPSASRRPSPAGCRSARSPPTSPSSSSPSSPCPARPCWSAARGRTSPSTTRRCSCPLAVLVTLAALALVRVRRRFTAVLLVGVVGYGVGGLFIVDGAPDLALAQFLVETLSLVAFVFVLRRMPGPVHPGAAAGAGPGAQGRDRGGRGRDGRRDGGRAQRRPPGTADDQRRVHPARPGGRRRD